MMDHPEKNKNSKANLFIWTFGYLTINIPAQTDISPYLQMVGESLQPAQMRTQTIMEIHPLKSISHLPEALIRPLRG